MTDSNFDITPNDSPFYDFIRILIDHIAATKNYVLHPPPLSDPYRQPSVFDEFAFFGHSLISGKFYLRALCPDIKL